ncbi:MAG TPA: hypothetical protein VFR11_10225 [Micromonosporaceae bacterium]|nr:hypothetical protein [Micromonosporaceae bacterium]
MFDEAGEDDLLLAAVVRLGAKGGALGGAVGSAATGGAGLGAGGKGGARGAARGFKWTKKDVRERTVELRGTVAEASLAVERALRHAGDLIGSETRDDGSVAMRATVGVGMGGLNPSVVTVVVHAAPDGTAILSVRAVGREGLIKQHPADKALAKVTALLPVAE